MSAVAVAGGAASIGRAIVDALVDQNKYEVIVLSRKAPSETEERQGVRVVVVDYLDTNSLVALFEQNNIYAVISTLGAVGTADAETSLIRAADRSTITKRFIPSVFGVHYRHDQAWFPAATSKIAAMAELEKTQLEWTAICNGFFLDYWGAPRVKSYLSPMTVVIDIQAKKAGIPGSGAVPVVFTYSADVARFTAASLTLEKWEKDSYIIGDKLSWNEFLKLAEEVRGSKFDVTYDSVDLLRSGKITELPGHQSSYAYYPKESLQSLNATFGLLFEDGQFNFKPKNSLNDLFPDIKPITAKEILEIGWKN